MEKYAKEAKTTLSSLRISDGNSVQATEVFSELKLWSLEFSDFYAEILGFSLSLIHLGFLDSM